MGEADMKVAASMFAILLLMGCGEGETAQSIAEDAADDMVGPVAAKVDALENRITELEERTERLELGGAI
ncbi:hypothetical protein [Sphingomonas sp. ABOLG]|uniref:hypothetical protein n=1 Tax=Sphingomonas sp. ABOLG TaxID=1985880 RepID=UPI000F7D8215|nr:hypothetical protein [Sphingomonas sp. ABOLG]